MTPLLVVGFLLAALACVASAEESALTSLLQPLDLRGYISPTTPPPFSGPALDGALFSLRAHRGAVVILNFWATWCVECRPEMAVFERLQREFSSRGFTVIGVNGREDEEAVRRYATKLGLSFPLVLDSDGKITALYGVVGLPTTFVVGRDGRAVAFAIGPRRWESAAGRALIEALLAERSPRTTR